MFSLLKYKSLDSFAQITLRKVLRSIKGLTFSPIFQHVNFHEYKIYEYLERLEDNQFLKIIINIMNKYYILCSHHNIVFLNHNSPIHALT